MDSSVSTTGSGSRLLSLRWALRLRGVVTATGLLLGGVGVLGGLGRFGAERLLVPAVVLLAVQAALALRFRSKGDVEDALLFLVSLIDVAVLSWLFTGAGGATNPFTVLYLLPLLVGALVLRRGMVVGLYAASVGAYAVLFWVAPIEDQPHDMESMALHLYGMLAAYVGTGALVSALIVWVRDAKERLDRVAREQQQAQERAQRLTSLATLAAGAAHELANPLGTLLVIAGELERSSDAGVRRDAGLLRDEVRRCQEVVRMLSVDTAAGLGEAPTWVDLVTLLEEASHGHGAIDIEAPEVHVLLPRHLVVVALRRLLGNARDASPEVIALSGRVTDDSVVLEVVDRGPGMPSEVLARAREPFYTTKAPGKGMGLGLYFADTVARELGGRLDLSSSPTGTRAVLVLPAPHRAQEVA